MHAWHAFLQDPQHQPSQAVIQDDAVLHFGQPEMEYQATQSKTILCDLSHMGLLQIQGEDRLNFLQGQLTNDIRLLNGTNAQYTGYCNPKGRLLALFLAFAHHDHIHLQLPKVLVESIAKRLKMFVMRSHVTITDTSAQIINMGIYGNEASTLLADVFPTLPQSDYEIVTHDNGTVIKLPGNKPRYQIFTSIANAPSLWNNLAKSAVPVGANSWEWVEIQAGIPTVMPSTQEDFVPQMLNLDALDAINYKKGCYTGQEIVARTHYLGKVKRRTQLATLESASAPQIGDDILDGAMQIVGKVVRVALNIENKQQTYALLFECRLDQLQSHDRSQNHQSLFWHTSPLTLKSLPYMLTE